LGQAFDQLDGDVLLYADRHGYLMLADGSQTLWLTSDDMLCDRQVGNWSQRGNWSPGGRYLAFTCGYAGSSTVVILDTQTGTFKRVDAGSSATNLYLAWPYPWSPTAAEFVIVVESNRGQELSLVDAATGRLKRPGLLELGNLWSAVAWSPDGDRIAVLRILAHGISPSPGIDPGLYIVDNDSSNPRLIADVFVDGAILHSLDWSRDGRSIVVDESVTDGLWAIKVSPDRAAQVSQPITNSLEVPTTFRWSPDGQRYLVKERLLDPADGTSPSGDRKPYWSLYDANSRLIRRYSSSPNQSVIDVAWMPDSRQIMMLVVADDATAEIVAADIGGRAIVAGRFPNATTGNLTNGRIAVAPRGMLVAIGLGSGRIMILDPQGDLRAELAGEMFEWRPRP
jgi:Tol biopolymer transport system component